MNVHIHTINKQSPNLDLQYGCTEQKKQRFFNDQGRNLILRLKGRGLSDKDIQTHVSKLMNSPVCDRYVRNNIEPLARRIGLTVNGRSVCASRANTPQLLLMQELSNKDREPLVNALSPYGYKLMQFETHQSKKERPEALRHGTAIFLRDPAGQLEVLGKTSLLVTKEDADAQLGLSTEKSVFPKKAIGNKAAVCAFRFKNSSVAFAACSEHLSGFNRLQERGPALDESRIPGVVQHESHLQKLLQLVHKLEQEYPVNFAAIVTGGDYNEDERFEHRLVDGCQVPDELYRLSVSGKYGFKLPENPEGQQVVRIVSEQGDQEFQIDFVTLKALGRCRLFMNYDAYREQVAGDIESYPSDHILISTILTIDE